MAYTPTGSGSTPPPAPRTGYVPTSDGLPFGSAHQEAEGGFGLFDFIGNVAGEAKDMAQGITSLIGAGMHDIASGAGEVIDLSIPGGAAEHTYKLDDIAMALPKALATDYNTRYGISKFAHGDIWGGFQAVLTGLYERPLSAIGDALMVGSAAKIGAKAGLLGETGAEAMAAYRAGGEATSLGQRVLGAGGRDVASITGSAQPISLSLSENPVARLGQQKLYDLMQYGSKGGDAQYIQGKVLAGATDEANRALDALTHNALRETPLPILRPTVSKIIEKHGVSKSLSLMGMNINDTTSQATLAARRVLEPLDDETRAMASSYAMGTEAPLPDMIPSTNPVELPQVNEPVLPSFEDVGFAHTPGRSPGLIDAAGQDPNLIHLGDSSAKAPIRAPHRLSDTGDSNAVQITVEDMSGGYDAAKRFADGRGGQIVAKMDYMNNPSSYDGLHYGVVGADGVQYDVSIATPEMAEAQRHWTHIASYVDGQEAEVASLQEELALAVQQGADGQAAAIERQIVELEDEIQAAEVMNANTFNFTRRSANMTDEIGYDPALAAVDRIRNITYNHATRFEVDHGLTFRKQLDRAFGPLRAEKWSQAMKVIEEHLGMRLEAALAAGAKKADLPPIVIEIVEGILGENNPFTEGIFRSLVDENIPFETGYTVGGKPAVMGERAVPGAPAATKKAVAAAPDRPIALGDDVEFTNLSQPDRPVLQGKVERVYKTNSRVKKSDPDSWTTWYEIRTPEGGLHHVSEKDTSFAVGGTVPGPRRIGGEAEDVVREQADDVPQMEEYEVSPATPGREAVFSGNLKTGEKTINPDSTTFRHPRASGMEQGRIGQLAEEFGGLENVPQELIDQISAQFPAEAAQEIALRLTNRLRVDTHTPMVENGEFPGMSWSDLAREQVTAGTPFPQYYPHIKSSRATGDVVMLNQHSANVPSVIESETGRMKKWGGWLYENGTFERDPIKAYEALFRQIQRHVEFRESMNDLVDKYGRAVKDPELAAWGNGQHGEVLISRNGLNGMVDSRTKAMTLTHEGVMSGRSLEQSTLEALDTVVRDSLDQFGRRMSGDEIWALPKYVAEQMKRSAKLNMPGQFNFYYDSAMGLWKSSVLSLSPRWVINNTLGNMVYMLGHNPSAIPRFIGQMMPGARNRFAATFGEEALRQVERDFMHGEDILNTTQKLARRSERGGVDVGTRIANSKVYQSAPVEAVRSVSSGIRRLNTQIEGAARRGVAIDAARRASITRTGSAFLKTNTLLEDFAMQGTPSRAHWGTVVKEVNRTLGDYLTMSPVEAQIIRRFVMPFYAFYRHTAKYLARMPFEHPLKFELLQRITQIDQQMNPYMPDYLLGATNIGGAWTNFAGANPFRAVTENYAPQVTNPLLGLAIQRVTGTNPFGQEWFPPDGAQVELFGGSKYAVIRDENGQVTGVRPMEGNWAPPLYESLLNIIPQVGMLPGMDPWDRSYKRRLLSQVGVSQNESYDPETAQYYAVQHQLDAMKQAMGQAPA